MNKITKVPKLRFPKFTDEWEQRKLKDIANKVTTKNSGTLYVETLTNSAEFGIISQKDFFDHNISNLENIDGYYIVENNDFVYNPRISTTAPVGPINRNKLGRSGVMSPLYTVFRTHDVDEEYVEWFFKSSKWHKFMFFNGDTGARSDRFAIKDSVFFEMPIPIPHIDEQRKIGHFFSNLDSLITLHQRKLVNLNNIKKSMLGKLFPKKGEKYPEVRFEGFTGEWEQRKLGKLGSLKNGMNFSKEAMGKGHPFVNLQNIFGRNTVDIENLGLAEATPKQLADYNLRQGDVLFVRSSVKLEGVGEAALVQRNLENTTYSGFIIRFRDEYGLDSDFKKYVFGTPEVRNQILSKATNSANKNISQSVLEDLEFKFPKLEEQQKIGLFLSSIDQLITLHQRKLDNLKNIKKGFLQQMFA